MTEDELAHIEGLPAVGVFLPYVFEDSTARLENITVKCGNCGADVNASNIKGTLTQTGQCVTLVGYARCFVDYKITPIEARLGNSGELLTRTKRPDGWVRGRWITQKPANLLQRVLRFFDL